MRPRVLSFAERLDLHPDYSGRGVCIAFVDSGFVPHPDLVRPESRVRAFVDVTREAPEPEDFLLLDAHVWHGTMTACAAAGNGYLSHGRYKGIAHGSEVVLLPVKSQPRAPILGRDVARAMRVPLRHPGLGVRIVNVSVGVDASDPDAADVERAAAELFEAGLLVVAAAGNTPDAPPTPPGSADAALGVGGIDDRNTRAPADDTLWPSSASATPGRRPKPDLLAPAVRLPAPMVPGTLVAREAPPLFQLLGILEEAESSAVFRQSRALDPKHRDEASLLRILEAVRARIADQKYIAPEYQHVDGTSFSAPIVSAVAAQMLEACSHLSPSQLIAGLKATCRKLEGVPAGKQGAGVVQPREAVEWARKLAAAERRDSAPPRSGRRSGKR